MKRILKNWHLVLKTLPIALILVLAKYVVYFFNLEVVTVNALYTSIVAGSIFLFGLILAGTLTDYKESEKLPAEIASGCQNIYEEARFIRELHPSFNISKLCAALNNIIVGFKEDIDDTRSRKSLEASATLTPIFAEIEKLNMNISPTYIARLKNEQAAIRKTLMRFYYIQRINFLPSAYTLVISMIVLVIVMLIFSRIEPLWDGLTIIFLLSFLFLYVIRLLKLLEKPFQKEGQTMDDVSLFLMEECQTCLLADKDK